MTTQSKVVLGIAAAALAGVAIGLLVAPESGEDTRNNIRRSVNDMAQNALDYVKNGQETLTEKANNAADTVKAKYNEAKGYVNGRMDEIKSQNGTEVHA